MDKTKVAVAVFNKCADIYQDKFMDVSLYHDTFDVFCAEIKKENPNILEIACGPGNITVYLLQKRPDFKILATDLAPNMVALGKKNCPGATFELMDVKHIGKLTEKFDGIMCGFGLPYLSKEETIQLIRDAYQVLNSGGILYLSTMEDDYGKSGLRKGSTGDEIFMHYHQEDYLTEALKKSGFTIQNTSRKEYLEPNGLKTIDLILIAQK